jgi:hypothetical protein
LNQLCYGADLERDFWASGIFVWDTERLRQLGADDSWLFGESIEDLFWPLTDNSLSEDESEDESVAPYST